MIELDHHELAKSAERREFEAGGRAQATSEAAGKVECEIHRLEIFPRTNRTGLHSRATGVPQLRTKSRQRRESEYLFDLGRSI